MFAFSVFQFLKPNPSLLRFLSEIILRACCMDSNLVPMPRAIITTYLCHFSFFLHFENLKVGTESGDIYE